MEIQRPVQLVRMCFPYTTDYDLVLDVAAPSLHLILPNNFKQTVYSGSQHECSRSDPLHHLLGTPSNRCLLFYLSQFLLLKR
ncbi:hypothetical protein TcWFU_002665 [Taenia crassiceps]|uniref:Uncharacterized protein n=1 Tax=Taenia crassiceps TaxID=6207 RepID=A0ABR4QKA9_9CEST